jgi:hypothetical protein
MVWINFNVLKWSAEEFGRNLDEVVLSTYSLGLAGFSEAFARSENHFKSGAAGIEDQDVGSYLGWIEEEFRQRRAALSAMALSLLAREIHSFHEELLRAVKSRCVLKTPLTKRSGLLRQIAEYRGYIAIEIEKGSNFETAREITLARNLALHPDGRSQREYREQTKQRLMDEANEMNFTTDLLMQFIEELKVYATWLAATVSDNLPPSK